MGNERIEAIFSDVLDCAFKVHSRLGPGLLENAYKKCLAYEIECMGYLVEVEKVLSIKYDDLVIEHGYRVDIIVENCVIIELKTVISLEHIHLAQILTYMKMAKVELGLLVNFNENYLKKGIKRVTLQKK